MSIKFCCIFVSWNVFLTGLLGVAEAALCLKVWLWISFTLTQTQTGAPHHRQEGGICVHAVPTGKKSTVEGFIEDLRLNVHLGSCKYVTQLNRFPQMKVVQTHLLRWMDRLSMSESTFAPNLLRFTDKPRTYELMRLAMAGLPKLKENLRPTVHVGQEELLQWVATVRATCCTWKTPPVGQPGQTVWNSP